MIILSLLVDKDEPKRKLGVELIKKARNQPPKNKIRYFNKEFKEKYINFNAQSYEEMLGDLNDLEEYTEPPCTKHIDEEELDLIQSGEKKLDIGHILCHSTHCERAVALTTKAAEKCCGYKARHGYILSKHHSRKSLGADLSKAEVLKLKHEFENCEMDTSE